MKKFLIVVIAISTTLFACNETSTKNEEAQVIETVSVEDFAVLIKDGGQLIDVRTPQENKEGHIEGSKLINVNDSNFKQIIKNLNKTEPVYVYCRSGKRSMTAARIMEEAGFMKVYNLDGGFNAWPSK